MPTIIGYAAKHAISDLRPIAFERRQPAANEVSIEITHCGVCHSDVHQAKNEWKNTVYPCLPGHEIVGRVSLRRHCCALASPRTRRCVTGRLVQAHASVWLERFGPDNLGSLVTLSTGHSEKTMLFFSAQALQALRREIQMHRTHANPGIETMLTQLDQFFETLQPDQLPILVDSSWPTQEYE